MKAPQQMSRTAVLVEGALMAAVAFALSILPIPSLPWGGSVTLCATLPILVFSLRHGAKWGVGTALVYSLLQLLLGMSNVVAVPVQTLFYMVLCALLDYVLAYTALGFCGPIAHRFKKPMLGLGVAVALTGAARLLCSFLSGILIWGPYAPEGWPVWLYSLAYNAAWCVPDVGIVLVGALAACRVKALGLLPGPADAFAAP